MALCTSSTHLLTSKVQYDASSMQATSQTPKGESSINIKEQTLPSLSLEHLLCATRGKIGEWRKGTFEEISNSSEKKRRKFGPSTQLTFGSRPCQTCVYKNSADHIFCIVRRFLLHIVRPKDCFKATLTVASMRQNTSSMQSATGMSKKLRKLVSARV